MDIKKAYDLLEENKNKFPDFELNNKTLGILHSVIGTIPDDYQWVLKIVQMKGTINQGIKEMEGVLALSKSNPEYSYLKTETLFFLMLMELNLQNDRNKAVNLLASLNAEEIKNPLLAFSSSSIALREGENDKAIEILTNRYNSPDIFPFYFLDFITGKSLLNRLDKNALPYLNKFVNNFTGQHYVKAAYQKIAWHYLINGDTINYRKNISFCKTHGNSFVDDDKQALRETESGIIPNIILIKARLFFDGGYYNKALSTLIEITPSKEFTNSKDRIEYIYRIGRIYDELENVEKAIDYYQLTYKTGINAPYYFAANSALQLGLIYEKQNKFDLAKEYFLKAMALKEHEYYNSISQKAKTGLKRIEDKS